MKSITRFHALLITLTLLMALVPGCKSGKEGSQIPPTSSGFPEVVMASKSLESVQAAVSGFFKNRGYVEGPSRHAYEQVFDKAASSGKAGEALRVVVRAQQEKDGTWRLIGVPMRVEGWRSTLESASVVPQGKVQIQSFLDQIKAMP